MMSQKNIDADEYQLKASHLTHSLFSYKKEFKQINDQMASLSQQIKMLTGKLYQSDRNNSLLQRKLNLLNELYVDLNYVEYNVLKKEYEEPPKEYGDMSRMKLYKCFEIEKSKVDTLKRKLRQET